MSIKIAGYNIIIVIYHHSLNLPECLPLRPKQMKPCFHFSTLPYVPHDQSITFSFISSRQFCFARCTNHEAHLYVNFSSPSFLPSFLTSSHSQTLPKTHTTISAAVLQFILVYISVSSEENTTAVATTEIRIHKDISFYRKTNCVGAV